MNRKFRIIVSSGGVMGYKGIGAEALGELQRFG